MATFSPNISARSITTLATSQLWELRDDHPEAREELVVRFLPLARRLASRYPAFTDSQEDLRQVASVGLVNAIDRYDPDRGSSFAAFAVPTILGELKRHFRNTGWAANVPRSTKELAMRVQRCSSEMSEHMGRTPNVAELADGMQVRPGQVLEGLEAAAARYSSSLDAPWASRDLGPTTLLDVIGTEDNRYALAETAITLSAGIRRLPYWERMALTFRLRDGLTQSEIARELGCSQMQVSRLLRRATTALSQELQPR